MFVDKNGVVRKPVAYVAGFYMFYEDATERADKYKTLCEKYGVIGIYPPQEECAEEGPMYQPKDDSHSEGQKKWFNRDINHLKYCDMVITQMEDFYGTEVESGTSFECGIGASYGKMLYGYLEDTRSMVERIKVPLHTRADNCLASEDGIMVEDFDFPVNHMFKDFEIIKGDLEDCLKKIRKDLDKTLISAGLEPYKVTE